MASRKGAIGKKKALSPIDLVSFAVVTIVFFCIRWKCIKISFSRGLLKTNFYIVSQRISGIDILNYNCSFRRIFVSSAISINQKKQTLNSIDLVSFAVVTVVFFCTCWRSIQISFSRGMLKTNLYITLQRISRIDVFNLNDRILLK